MHESIVDQFVPAFCNAVDALVMGLPFTEGVKITPLPGTLIERGTLEISFFSSIEPNKPGYIQQVIADAIEKGAW